MTIFQAIIELLVESAQGLLIDALSERVRSARRPALRGMSDVRRHVQKVIRVRLMKKISTER